MKKFLSMGLCMVMLLSLLTGCGQQEQKQESDVVGKQVTSSEHDQAADNAHKDSTEVSIRNTETDEELVTIKAKLLNNTVNAAGAERVLKRLNELTESKINTHVDAEFIEFGAWNQTINLMISGSETVDVISLSPMLTIDMLEKQNALMDITGLVDTYAPESKLLLEKILPSTTKDNKLYGIPKLSDQDQVRCIYMREDILKEMGMVDKAKTIKSWSELEELLLAVKEQHPELTPLFVSYNSGSTPGGAGDDNAEDQFSWNCNLDNAGDSYKFVYVDPETGNIESLYESDMYASMVKRMSDWYQKGLIYTDGAVTDDDATTAMSAGKFFCYYGQGKSDPDIAASEMEGWTGQDLICVQLYHLQALTTNINMFGFAVPYTSTEPEAAVKFINLMMTDPEVTNLLSYGEEGIDYILVEGVAKYPDGLDATSVGYHSQSFLFGNELQAHPWDGTTPEIQENALDYYLNKMETPLYFGFTADTDAITTEITACYNATLEYRPMLECGSAQNWEETLQQFRKKLKDCGIDKIVETYREQGRQFLESSK